MSVIKGPFTLETNGDAHPLGKWRGAQASDYRLPESPFLATMIGG
jgi:hypothetical protein